jgi:hypothetical protein
MSAVGGGIYEYQTVLAPGNYMWKAVVTGSWDAIGNDFRGINSDNTSFTVTAGDPLVTFWVNALNGSIEVVTAIPEPSTAALLGLAGLALLVARQNRK